MRFFYKETKMYEDIKTLLSDIQLVSKNNKQLFLYKKSDSGSMIRISIIDSFYLKIEKRINCLYADNGFKLVHLLTLTIENAKAINNILFDILKYNFVKNYVQIKELKG